MVAPFFVGEPIRSFVRVPESGSDRTAVPTCCDLSRVANIAPASPLPSAVFSSARVSNDQSKLAIKKRATMMRVVNGSQPPASMAQLAAASRHNRLKRPLTDVEVSPPAKVARTHTLTQLLKERQSLQQANKELQRKLQMFQTLFRDRTKLNEVLARLDKDKN